MTVRLEDSQALRRDFRRKLGSLLGYSMLISLSGTAIAAPENFPPNIFLGTSGDWATVTAPGTTVKINTGDNLGSSDTTSTGFSVSAGAFPDAIVSFQGNSNVVGTIGVDGGVKVANVNGGAAGTTVTFQGEVASKLVTFTDASTMIFNTTSSAALHFADFNGTAELGPGVTFNGAATATTANRGILTLNNGSFYNGGVGDGTFFINQINLPTGNATIKGATVSQNITVGPNTLTMQGALAFPAGSAFNLTASSDNTFGQILAIGQAIDLTKGLIVNVDVPNGAVFSGAPLQVISGEDTSGHPILVNSLNPRFSFTGLNTKADPAGNNTSNNVLLFPSLVSALPPGSVASGAGGAFDAAFFGATGDLLFVGTLINALTLPEIAAAQAQFAPIVNGDNAMMGFQALNQFQDLWSANLLRARGADICYDRCAPAGCPTMCDPCSSSGRKNAWNGEGLWIDGFIYNADQHTRQQIAGFDGQIIGLMAAVQQPISEHWQAGLGAGYAKTHITGDSSTAAENHMSIDTIQGTAFLGYNKGSWFLDSFFTYEWNDYDGYRNIVFPGLDRVANSDYDGEGYSLLFSTGYNLYFKKSLTVTPLASIKFQTLHIDGYTETGADSLDLVQDSQKYDVVQSGLGLMAGFPLLDHYGNIFYTELHAIWHYDFENDQYKNTSRFQGGGPAFETLGVRPARNEYNLGISTTLYTFGNLSLQFGYDAYFRHNYFGQKGNVSMSFIF